LNESVIVLTKKTVVLTGLIFAASVWLLVWAIIWGGPLRTDLPVLDHRAKAARDFHLFRAGYDPATGDCKTPQRGCAPIPRSYPELEAYNSRLLVDLLILGVPLLMIAIAASFSWHYLSPERKPPTIDPA
jgi:hypothetical protein